MRIRTLSWVSLFLALCVDWIVVPAFAQQCPQSSATEFSKPSKSRALEGQLIYHDDIRKWFELKLSEPQCGQSSVQLIALKKPDWTPLEILRGCRVKSTGPLDFSPTGYYSLDSYQDVTQIEPVGSCVRQPPFPDYSHAKPDKTVRGYRVEMDVDYSPGDHPIVFHVSSGGRELKPWQAYASYWLTGGFVLYGHCADGFQVDKVFGTPQANPGHFTERGEPDDMAAFSPENAAAAGKSNLRLGYTCVRMP
jgi:hypothetical protein